MAIAAGTPIEKFQSNILSQLHSLASFIPLDSLSSPSAGDLRLTPPFVNPRFLPVCVDNLLYFFLLRSS
jgi:hypothetical protein